MSGLGCFGSLLGVTFLERKALPFLHHLFPLLVPLPLFVGKVRLGSLSRGRGERLDLVLRCSTIASGSMEVS